MGPPSAEPELSSAQIPLSASGSPLAYSALLSPVFNFERPACSDSGQPGGRSSFLCVFFITDSFSKFLLSTYYVPGSPDSCLWSV